MVKIAVLRALKSYSGPEWVRAVQIQKILAGIAARSASGEFFDTRFFAIGLFRMLELTEARDPRSRRASSRCASLSHFRDVMCVTAQFKHRSQSWSEEIVFVTGLNTEHMPAAIPHLRGSNTSAKPANNVAS